VQLRWSPAAAEDFLRIIEYIRQENPAAAQRIAKTVYDSAGSLKSFQTRVERVAWKGRVNFLCHRFPLWWFTESSKILWKSQTLYTVHRSGHQRTEAKRAGRCGSQKGVC
jgi:plasmid stabilization system protein ParE